MVRAIFVLSLGLLVHPAAWAQSPAEPARHAILIVNSTYRHLPALPSPHLDRPVLEDALQKCGFEITVFEDNLTSVDPFDEVLQKKVKPGDVVLLFYAGYAVQFRRDNFLLPVSYDPALKEPLVSAALSLKRLTEDLDDSKASVKVVMLDASREEKAIDSITSGINSDPGLAHADGPDTFVLFSAPENQTAPAGPAGEPGRLAAAFAKAIVQPGSDLDRTMREVALSLGNSPYFNNRVTRTLYFTPPAPVAPVSPPPPSTPPPPAIDMLTRIPQTHRPDREDYRFMPKGTFQMGCVPSGPCEAAEKPRHEVHLTRDFWMAATDVTFADYQRYVSENKGQKLPKQPFWVTMRRTDWTKDDPVLNVSWDDAQAYCKWAGGRLPTEAEWEYAARAGRPDQVYPGDGENSRDKANFSGQSGNDIYEYTSPVKSFDPNPWGLFDMAGNVWQWTADWYDPNYFSSSPADDPPGPATAGKERVARGGSFSSEATKQLRISYRDKFVPAGQDNVGFRCILPDGPETRANFATGQ